MTKRARVWSVEERRQLLTELEGCGMSVAAFAQKHGVSAWSIYSWRRQERERKNKREDGPTEFIQVQVAPSRESLAPLEVELTDGVRVHVRAGFDEDELRRLLGVLASC